MTEALETVQVNNKNDVTFENVRKGMMEKLRSNGIEREIFLPLWSTSPWGKLWHAKFKAEVAQLD